jgi:outer membrane protein assembly factor BamB
VRPAATTRCCSAIALAIALCGTVVAQSNTQAELGLFPVQPAWTVSLDAAVAAPPVFAGSRGYFPIEGGRLVAYDLRDGSLAWTAAVRTASQPAAGNDLVFVAEPDALTAITQADGTVAWRLPFAEPLGVPLVWSAGWLIAVSASGTLHAFRAADGHQIWSRELGAAPHATPEVSGDRVYVPLDDARLVALAIEDGTPVWERRLGGPPNQAFALEDRIYVGSNDNFLYCLRTADGRVDWRWRTGADVIGLPIVDERRVYFVSFDNVLRALDRQSGAQRWKRALPIRPTRGPARAAAALLVSGAAAKVSAFSLRDGSPAGEITAAGELAGAPYVTASGPAGLPMVIVAGRDIVKGTVVSAFVRSVEPAIAPLAPLPNPVSLPPIATGTEPATSPSP